MTETEASTSLETMSLSVGLLQFLQLYHNWATFPPSPEWLFYPSMDSVTDKKMKQSPGCVHPYLQYQTQQRHVGKNKSVKVLHLRFSEAKMLRPEIFPRADHDGGERLLLVYCCMGIRVTSRCCGRAACDVRGHGNCYHNQKKTSLPANAHGDTSGSGLPQLQFC